MASQEEWDRILEDAGSVHRMLDDAVQRLVGAVWACRSMTEGLEAFADSSGPVVDAYRTLAGRGGEIRAVLEGLANLAGEFSPVEVIR